MLTDVMDGGEAFLQSLRFDVVLGAVALSLLIESGAEVVEDQDPAELASAMIEAFAVMLRAEGSELVMAQLADVEPEALASFVEHLTAVGHPQAFALLDAIAVHHPDRRIAKQARKARAKAQGAAVR